MVSITGTAIDDIVKAYVRRGNLCGRRNDWNRALHYYSLAIQLDKRNLRAYNNRGSVFLEQRKFRKAIRDYSRAISLNPEFIYAYLGRSFAYFSKGNYCAALMDGDKAVENASDMWLKRKCIEFRKQLLEAIYMGAEINGEPRILGSGRDYLMIIPYTSPKK